MSKQYEIEAHTLLTAQRLPAQLYAKEAAFFLRISPEDLNHLAVNKLIKPVGKPTPNAPKYYLTQEVLSKSNDSEWMNKMNVFLSKHRRDKNLKYRKDEPQDVTSAELPQ